MTANKKLKRKVCNLNIRTHLLYIGSFYLYMTIMIWWYWFWIDDFIFVDQTIFLIVHIFMYMIIYMCFGGGALIWDKLMWKEIDLWKIYLWESRKIWLKVLFLGQASIDESSGIFFQSSFTLDIIPIYSYNNNNNNYYYYYY